MSLIETLRPVATSMPRQGFLNTLNRWEGLDGTQYVSRRHNADQSETLANLQEEYGWIGFTGLGGTYAIRTAQEQMEFTQRAESLGLSVVPFVGEVDGELFMPLCKGVDLDRALGAKSRRLLIQGSVLSALTDIIHAHHPRVNMPYGDRWTKNIKITHGASARQLDFDIAIHGPVAREFEIAQFFYSLVRDSKELDVMLGTLKEANLSTMLAHHDKGVLVRFLDRYADWYWYKYPDKFQQANRNREGLRVIRELVLH